MSSGAMTDRTARYLKLMLTVIFFLSVTRAYFLLMNINLFKSASLKNTFFAFLKGLSADIPVVLAINLIFAVVYFLPKTAIFQNKQAPRVFLSGVFWLLNLPLLFVSLFNAEYFKLAGENLSELSFHSLAKMGSFESIFSHLVPRLIIISLIILLFVLFTKKYFYEQKEVYLSGLRQLAYFVFVVGISAYFVNTKFSSKGLAPSKHVEGENSSIHYLEKNTMENILKNHIIN